MDNMFIKYNHQQYILINRYNKIHNLHIHLIYKDFYLYLNYCIVIIQTGTIYITVNLDYIIVHMDKKTFLQYMIN